MLVGWTWVVVKVRGGWAPWLNLVTVLVIANQFVIRIQLVGPLGRWIPESRVMRLWEEIVGQTHAVLLIAIRKVPPQFVALDRTADVDVGVVVALDFVAVRLNRAVVEGSGRRVLVRDVRTLERVVVPVEVILTRELIAAGASDGASLNTRVRHLGGLRAGSDERLHERSVVEVETGEACASVC